MSLPLPGPLPGDDDGKILDLAEAWLAEGRQLALASVINTWGSGPRPVGSHLVIDAAGRFSGSVSGGCIEAAVITEAREVIASGQARRLEFGVSDAEAWAVGLACGGAIEVHVARLDPEFLAALQQARRAGRTVASVTDLTDGTSCLVGEDATVAGGLALTPGTLREIAALAAITANRVIETETRPLFVRSYGPPWQMAIVGAVHIAQSLAPMAALAGFAVTVIDPREAFASEARFPGSRLAVGWPDEVLELAPPGAHHAIVALTHDPKIDDPALIAALRSKAFYVGALGSRKTHAKRLDRLAEAGFGEADLARIHAPVGLDLGGRLPAEIAVAILAEIIACRYGGAVARSR